MKYCQHYDVLFKSMQQVTSLQLISIPKGQFKLEKVTRIKVTDYNHVFFELRDCTVSKDSDIIDLILLEKVCV